MNKHAIHKVVVAYSGGLDTSVIIPWLKDNYDCQIIAFVADVGQGDQELEGIYDKAIASGADDCHVVDLKEAFVSDYIYPVLKTGATYEGKYLLGTSMARPIIAKAQVELAKAVGADALCHGCTGKGNDQVRFESTYAALAPELTVIAPWREWDLRSREDCLSYLAERGIACTASLTKIYSRDANVWHISTEGGVLESTWSQADDDCWVWTNSAENAPNEAAYVKIGIENGEIVQVNDEQMTPFNALTFLNQLGAEHGIGRIDIVENRLVGMKSRGCYETPGGTIMMEALRAVEQLVLDKNALEFRQQLGLKASHLVYEGQWFTPLWRAIMAASDSLATEVCGEVLIKLYKGNVSAIQKQSSNSLYSEDFATFGADEVYDQSHAAGFIRLYSLPSRIRALKKTKAS